MSNPNRLSEEEIDKRMVDFTSFLNKKYKPEESMVVQKIHRRDRLTKTEKNQIKILSDQGKTQAEIAKIVGRSTGAVSRALKKKRYYIPKSERVQKESDVDWKAKYLKAVALLVEHNLIDIEF